MAVTDLIPKNKRGIFVNPRAGLFLQFQLNPTEIDYDLTPNYEEEPIIGHHTSHVFWSSNAPMKISFELFFDTRTDTQVQLFSLGDVGLGVLGVRAVLESFLYPAEVDLFQRENLRLDFENLQRLFNSNRFFAPPDVYFIFGLRWFRGKLASAPFKEKSFDNNLIPQQLEVPVSITVLEDGAFKKYRENLRKGLAATESARNVIELPFNITL